jgi:glycerophosphoryl diester phosphodiesterase
VALPEVYRQVPFAHRGLHGAGRAENSLPAFKAAVDAGYGIELDLQPSADGEAMVFHDADLSRLLGREGLVARQSARALASMDLPGGSGPVPTLARVLDLVAGRVPLLIEIKDQSGWLGPVAGALERRTAEVLASYGGPVAVMSFNPHAMAAFRPALPACPAGLTTCAFGEDWPLVPLARRAELRDMPDLARLGLSFISHDKNDLAAPAVARARADGRAVLCWTIRSSSEEAAARRFADSITFEGFLPAVPPR